ncbi:hypothetical protein HDV06_002850 [Boothiomyces sp. JEL0866]|nr:hypothetical protein HDV06_002850 [Boothiomyces sp. JEL0866]
MCKKTIHSIKNLDLNKISVYLIIKDIRDLNVLNFNLNNVYVDPDLQFYKVLGEGELRKMPIIQLLHPKLISNAIKARYDGFLDSPQISENRILGGGILISDAGEIVYKYLEVIAGDQPNLRGKTMEFNVTIYIVVKDENDFVDFDRSQVLVDKKMDFYKILGDGEDRIMPISQSGDQPDLIALINACQALKNQEYAEQDYLTAFASESLVSIGFDFSKIT